MRNSNVVQDAMIQYNIPSISKVDDFLIEVVRFINENRKINAIKTVKRETGFGLKESKDFVFTLAEIPSLRLEKDLYGYIRKYCVSHELTEQEYQKNKFNEKLL